MAIDHTMYARRKERAALRSSHESTRECVITDSCNDDTTVRLSASDNKFIVPVLCSVQLINWLAHVRDVERTSNVTTSRLVSWTIVRFLLRRGNNRRGIYQHRAQTVSGDLSLSNCCISLSRDSSNTTLAFYRCITALALYHLHN